MNTPAQRKQKVKRIQAQVAEGVHPLQHTDHAVRKKVALRVADKMVNGVLEKQK
jgi:hypothetical protein